jgi:predicted unusual protein kinase regulating ubiquinone biosynthesis (AarF/ABC1/UbiB family)
VRDTPESGGGVAASASTPASDVQTAEGRWVRVRALFRVWVVVYRFLPLLATYLRDRNRFLLVGRSRRVTESMQRERAERLLETLVELGPTFIKLGQILSTRPDALPPTYIEVLSRLQDKVPPDDWAEIRPVIEAEVGPVDERFDDFDTEPISGASLGQVYTATVDGETVAVKVLRPNIRRRVETDLQAIAALLPVLVRFAHEGQRFTLENLAEEFSATIREEMDYEHEAAMLETVRANLADRPDVVVPPVVEELSGSRVLTMEYVGGTKIDQVSTLDEMGIDRSDLVERLEETYIQMIIEDGVFHADPHPGNLAVQDDGTIVFYDFGMTGYVTDFLQERIIQMYVAIANDDVDAVVDAFVEMGALDPAADRNLMAEMFEVAIDSFRGQDLDEYRIRRLIGEFQGTFYEFPLRLPQNVALIVRVTTVLDGVAQTLDPSFDVIALITEYVRESGHTAEAGRQQFVEAVREEGQSLARGLVSVPPKLEGVLDRLDRDSLTISVGLEPEEPALDALALQVSTGLLFSSSLLSTLLLWLYADVTATAVAAVLSGVLGVVFLRAFRSRRRGVTVRRRQFTRQSLREQEPERDDEPAEASPAQRPE